MNIRQVRVTMFEIELNWIFYLLLIGSMNRNGWNSVELNADSNKRQKNIVFV